MGSGVIDEHIGREIEHLYPLIPLHVESLSCLVGREGTIVTAWMPVGIDHRTTQQVVLCLQPLAFTLCLNHGGTMGTTDMEHEMAGVCTVRHMAVKTLSRHLRIIKDGCLVKIRQVTLIESHMTIDLIARSNTAVCDAPLIQGIGTDKDLKVLVLQPSSVLADTDSNGQLTTFVLFQ